MKVHVDLLGPENGGANDGTPDLLFGHPHGIVVQLPAIAVETARSATTARQRVGTPEPYFTDPDGLLIQLQNSNYCGGSGFLGDLRPIIWLTYDIHPTSKRS
jgi:hypothetical protein